MAKKPAKKVAKKAAKKAARKPAKPAVKKAAAKASSAARSTRSRLPTKTPFERDINRGLPRPAQDLPLEEYTKRLAFLVLMCANGTLFLDTFTTKGLNLDVIVNEGWFTEAELPVKELKQLAKSRALFADMQHAWKTLGPYQDPPCPRKEVFQKLVDYMKNELHKS